MNNNEPIVLGNVKKGKTGKPLLVLILFLFIGAILLILPVLNNYFAGYNIIELIVNGELISFIQNHEQYVNNTHLENKDNSTTTVVVEDEEKIVFINKKAVIKHNNFNISDFVLNESNIEYTINTTTSINFDKSNYYLILTKNNEKIIIKLTGEVNGRKKYTFSFLNALSSIIEVEGTIKEISSSDYTNFNLSKNESGIGQIFCTKDSETYTYIFNNNNLVNIREHFKYTKNKEEDYDIIFDEYMNIYHNITLLGGFSQLIQTTEGFVLLNNIDLNTYDFSQNKNYNYYSLNTMPKIVNFEMEAKGYDCK